MPEEKPIEIEREGHVAWLTLSRPEKRNAMTRAFFASMREAFAELDADADVRVVVIRGQGKSFSAGIDLGEAATLLLESTADAREKLRLGILELQDAFTAVERCRKPVIAAVHGHCIGGGVDLLCACDVRMASRDAVFSVRETRLAMIADLGTLQRMQRIVGEGWFRELVFTGRDFTAEEAMQMGFVTRLCDDREAVILEAGKLAGEIADNSPLAVQGAKEVILYSREHGVKAGLEYVATKNSSALHCDDLMEAVQAHMMKRKPEFKGR
jgi:enoyl-CoA hydratase/carnithine racemase